jgi:diguanylate cyclase (GGDEF)-like protein
MDVELLPPKTSIREVVAWMRVRRRSCAVIGSDSVPAGVITERDLVELLDRLMTEPEILECAAADVMSSPPTTVSTDQSLFDALVISRAERLRHLPVVDADNRLAGLVTYTDLAEAQFHMIEQQHHQIEQAVADRTASLQETNERLLRLSMEDGLLGIGNRRAMEVDLEHTHQTATRYDRAYSVALLDIDHFKSFNDYYGHPQGDACLQAVCEFIKSTVRGADRLYRYGGEEFLLLLPATGHEGGYGLSARLVDGLFKLGLTHCKSPYGVVTMSTGIATCPTGNPDNVSWTDLVAQADAQLYQAKCRGRNRAA